MSEDGDLNRLARALGLSEAACASDAEGARKPSHMPSGQSWVSLMEEVAHGDFAGEGGQSRAAAADLMLAILSTPMKSAVEYWERYRKFPRNDIGRLLIVAASLSRRAGRPVEMPPGFAELLGRFLAGELSQTTGPAIPFDGPGSFVRRLGAILEIEERLAAGEKYEMLCSEYADRLCLKAAQVKDLITESRKYGL